MMGVPVEKKADIVVVSCGGYPKDINLYQGVKSLINAAEAVKDGGTIIFSGRMQGGRRRAGLFLLDRLAAPGNAGSGPARGFHYRRLYFLCFL